MRPRLNPSRRLVRFARDQDGLRAMLGRPCAIQIRRERSADGFVDRHAGQSTCVKIQASGISNPETQLRLTGMTSDLT